VSGVEREEHLDLRDRIQRVGIHSNYVTNHKEEGTIMKKTLYAMLAVFVLWSAMDFIIHGLVLASPYAATPQLWRPMGEMKSGLMYMTVLIAAVSFVGIYAWFIGDKSVKTAVRYGLVFGVGSGISMGYGSYSVMPLPYEIALGWFLGSLIEAVVAGWITGLIVKKEG
jgi:hypothetical protein